MEYVLTGFQQDRNIRQYAFDGIGADRRRMKFTVGVDLGLIRKYEISVQELPLLCRHYLEVHAEDGQAPTLMYTEEEMIVHAGRRTAAQHAADEKKAHRRHPTGGGQAWRSPRTTQPASE